MCVCVCVQSNIEGHGNQKLFWQVVIVRFPINQPHLFYNVTNVCVQRMNTKWYTNQAAKEYIISGFPCSPLCVLTWWEDYKMRILGQVYFKLKRVNSSNPKTHPNPKVVLSTGAARPLVDRIKHKNKKKPIQTCLALPQSKWQSASLTPLWHIQHFQSHIYWY